jgi:DUF971 family protein
MAAADPSTVPLELDLDRSRHLRIRWADGVQAVLPLRVVRQNCPCATCRAERDEQARNPLRVVQPPRNESDAVTVADAELVGRYALKIEWRDGHSTGIHDFVTLRRLCDVIGAAEMKG